MKWAGYLSKKKKEGIVLANQTSIFDFSDFYDEGFEKTERLDQAIYVFQDGSLWSGYSEGGDGSTRDIDHGVIEAFFKEASIDRSHPDFQSLKLEELIQIIPETRTVLVLSDNQYSQEQLEVLHQLEEENFVIEQLESTLHKAPSQEVRATRNAYKLDIDTRTSEIDEENFRAELANSLERRELYFNQQLSISARLKDSYREVSIEQAPNTFAFENYQYEIAINGYYANEVTDSLEIHSAEDMLNVLESVGGLLAFDRETQKELTDSIQNMLNNSEYETHDGLMKRRLVVGPLKQDRETGNIDVLLVDDRRLPTHYHLLYDSKNAVWTTTENLTVTQENLEHLATVIDNQALSKNKDTPHTERQVSDQEMVYEHLANQYGIANDQAFPPSEYKILFGSPMIKSEEEIVSAIRQQRGEKLFDWIYHETHTPGDLSVYKEELALTLEKRVIDGHKFYQLDEQMELLLHSGKDGSYDGLIFKEAGGRETFHAMDAKAAGRQLAEQGAIPCSQGSMSLLQRFLANDQSRDYQQHLIHNKVMQETYKEETGRSMTGRG